MYDEQEYTMSAFLDSRQGRTGLPLINQKLGGW